MQATELQRREFIFGLAALQAAASLNAQTSGDMIYRNLGKTGERVSAIGLGGAHIAYIRDDNEVIRLVRAAVDRGITFLDNSWDYSRGRAETLMGKALLDGYRKRIFLMTKFNGRTKAVAAQQIDESLRRLQTEQLDMIQFHENIRMEDADRYFAPGGAHEAVMEAKKAGKVRYVGFTGHKDPAVHLRMLDVAAVNKFHFDACQLPLNVLDFHFRSFTHDVVPRLVREGTAVLGMKPMAFGVIPKEGIATAIECLHYALNLPTSVVITGCDSMERLDQAFEAAKTFKPLSKAQLSALVGKTKVAAMSGKYEVFKTGTRFDGTAQRPAEMG